ncbi:ribosomal protein S5 domain 2-like protein [Lactarius deliciosus]|nr:ribosomal protein S5 domain 2-like protein [Lactarius deliciosus]
MRPPSPSIPEKDFFFAALDQDVRLDGRSFLEPRTLDLSFGAELGHVECSLGKTRVLAHVDAKMVRPEPQRPFEGLISIHCELSPMAGAEYEAGRSVPAFLPPTSSPHTHRSSEEETALARHLDKIFRRSDAIDREALCVLTGERVWHLRLSVHVLSAASSSSSSDAAAAAGGGGGLLDCASLACAAALRHFRRPEVEVHGTGEVTVYAPSARAPVPLALHHTPFCVSFAFYSEGKGSEQPKVRMLLDPAGLELRLAHGVLVLVLTAQRELAVVHKAGGLPLAPEMLIGAVEIAARRARELETWLDVHVREDWARKNVEVR